ncbi:molecular chaperone DnaJ [Sulfurovum sp.]|uniref:molecular chaperone DnaJ n=1 Tax=Sulfurovum sp. TaxID=1969726 RepID=UPI0028680E11|nr:molecular chaperone DnaJ [Sulfurovum sp.]
MIELDYYEVLEVSKDSSGAELKKAYRKLAMKYHPDRNPDDKEAEDNFKVVNEAYQILSDEEKRAVYDRYGKAGLEGQGMGRRGFGGGNMDDVMDIFNSMFGGSGGFGQTRKDPKQKYALDFEIELKLEFHEAVFGCKKEIDMTYKTSCEDCDGTGAKDAKLESCDYCGGQGQVLMRQGPMQFAQTCPKCKGQGQKIKEPCASCEGKGFHIKEDTVIITIPAGVDSGHRLRAEGYGNEGRNNQRGDLYITFAVKEDENFVRNGTDIYIIVPVFFTQSLLGETISIPTLEGELDLKLNKGTVDKEQYMFPDQGVVDVHTGRKGRLVAQVELVLPKKVNEEQKELLQKLQESYGIESHPHKSTFDAAFERVKNWFKN